MSSFPPGKDLDGLGGLDGLSGLGGLTNDPAAVVDRLKSLLRGRRMPPPAPEERCELCGTPIPPEHRHLVNLETRSLVCACRPCGLLFTHGGAAGGKYRAVPERYLLARDLALTEGQWESLQIPVSIAFFFHNSTLGSTVAFYPGPAGATESLLPLALWEEWARQSPLLASLEPDVEALLVRRRAPRGEGTAGDEGFIVPIDACYELVGRMRRRWKGFEGGEEAWQEIDAFFATLRERSGA